MSGHKSLLNCVTEHSTLFTNVIMLPPSWTILKTAVVTSECQVKQHYIKCSLSQYITCYVNHLLVNSFIL